MRPPTRLATAILLLSLAALPLAGCFNPFDPQVRGFGVSAPPPVPDSPVNALRLLEWCYGQRAINEYRELFSADYRFVFGLLDETGNAYRDQPWTREDDLESTTNLFQGGDANQPAATSIVIVLDRNPRVTDDPNFPGSRWRRLIRTSVLLRVTDANSGQREASGFANFFLVRGDSAVIPPDLAQRGFVPDSNRWYIRRHEDDTPPPESEGLNSSAPATGVLTAASFRLSWGHLKVAYR